MKFFSFRIHWISNQVASAEVIYMTLFPFSQAKVLSCSRQKLIKLCQRNMIFFFTLHKAVKKPGFASFAFNMQNLSHSSRHNPGSVGQPTEFSSKGNSRSAVGEEMALTPSGAGRDVAHIQKCGSTGIYRDNLYFRSNLRAHRHIVCVYLCVDI